MRLSPQVQPYAEHRASRIHEENGPTKIRREQVVRRQRLFSCVVECIDRMMSCSSSSNTAIACGRKELGAIGQISKGKWPHSRDLGVGMGDANAIGLWNANVPEMHGSRLSMFVATVFPSGARPTHR